MPESEKRPACERCRRRRVKCDRAAPQCGQCAEVNVSCEYRSRNAAAIFMLYAQDLEAEIAQLERELDAEADDHVPTPPTSFVATTISDDGATATEDATVSDADMANLIESIGKVSLSATTEKDAATLQCHDLLTTLILSAAVPIGVSQITVCSPGLPPRDMVDTVLQAYLQRLYPTRPFISQEALISYCNDAYDQFSGSKYAEFIVGLIVATTVVRLSPTSLASAIPLYHFSVQRLASSLGSEPNFYLRELEAVIVLANFAQCVPGLGQRGENAGDPVPEALLPDLAHLSALAIRIAVDHGLHQNAQSLREKQLFAIALNIEAETTKRLNLPIALQQAAVSM